MCGGNLSLQTTWDTCPRYRWNLRCHLGPAGGRPEPNCPLPVPAAICRHHVPPGQTNKTHGARGGTLLWGRGRLGCEGIGGWRGVGVWGHSGLCLWRKKRAGVSWGQQKQHLWPSPCSVTHCEVPWLTPTLQSCSREGSEAPSTLPALRQVWGAGHGMHSVGRGGGIWDQDAGCRIRVWGAGQRAQDQDAGCRIRIWGAGSGCGMQDAGFRTQC